MARGHSAHRFVAAVVRDWRGRDRRLIEAYLRSHAVKRLHVGCGRNVLDGWLNCDLHPRTDAVVQLDATKPFPLPDNQFDYVFSEHVIEHLPFDGGASMLAECYRVLRPGGRIRMSTPDLAFLVGLYLPERSALQQRYVDWMSATPKCTVRPPVDGPGPPPAEVFVINNFMTDWGHRFIYDERTLRYSLQRARFAHVVKCPIGESGVEDLRGLEHETRLPEGFLQLETVTLEAEK
jgi:SAM-dependent methyltransferase